MDADKELAMQWVVPPDNSRPYPYVTEQPLKELLHPVVADDAHPTLVAVEAVHLGHALVGEVDVVIHYYHRLGVVVAPEVPCIERLGTEDEVAGDELLPPCRVRKNLSAYRESRYFILLNN